MASSNARKLCKLFSYQPDGDQPRPTLLWPDHIRLRPASLILILGPSGSGKSTLLRTIHRAHPATALPASDRQINWTRPAIDAIPRPLEQALRIAGLCGLADVPQLIRPARRLSSGQRHRLILAHTVAVALERNATTLLLDEFAEPLDRLCAWVLAHGVRRLANATRLCFVVATSHDDLIEPLAPDAVLLLDQNTIHTCTGPLQPGPSTPPEPPPDPPATPTACPLPEEHLLQPAEARHAAA